MLRLIIPLLFFFFIPFNQAMPGSVINYLDAWKKLAQAKIKFQKKSTSFFFEKCPKFSKTINTYRELQISLINKKSYQLGYIHKKNPERLKTISNSGELLNFKWNPSDEAKLINDKNYANIIGTINILKKKSVSSPHWSNARACISGYSSSDEFNSFMDELNSSMNKIDLKLSVKTN